MKGRSLINLVICLTILVAARTAWAEEKSEERRTWCSVYSEAQYLVGEFSGDSGTGSLDRKNLLAGVACNYRRFNWLVLSTESALTYGALNISYQADSLEGVASYTTVGVKESLVASFIVSGGVKINVLAGVEEADAKKFELQKVTFDLGNGPVDFTFLALDHLSSSGRIRIIEAGANAEIKSWWNDLSFTFGGLFQRPYLSFRFDADKDINTIIDALMYDRSKVNRTISKSVNFLSLTPGVKWSGKDWGVSLQLNGGLVSRSKWSCGGTLKIQWNF